MIFRPLLGPLCCGTLLAWSSLAEGQAVAVEPKSDADIVVTAKRYGEAKVASERELDEEDISDYGSDSVADLLKQISPLIDGSGKQPEILVNGQRIGDPKSIASYPPEALQRIEILPGQAAGQYGISPDKRVVNLVLKKSFSNLADSGGFSAPVRGGYGIGQVSAQYFSVEGPQRWNASVTLGRSSALLQSERKVSPFPGMASTGGNLAAAQGGEIDPALSEIAGFPVTSLSVPAAASDGALPLAAFAAGAGKPGPRDDASYRSILPQGRNASVTLGMSRPIGSGDLSLSLTAGKQNITRLLGLAEADLLIPASSPFSPFASDVTLSRLLEGKVLTGRQASSNINASADFEADIGKHYLMASLGYAWQETATENGRGFDLGQAQAAIAANDPALNPFGPLPLGPPQTDRVHSASGTLSGYVLFGGPLPLHLPAGAVGSSLSINYTRSSSRTEGLGADASAITRERTDAAANVNFPLTSKREGFLPGLGELGISVNGSLSSSTGEGWRGRYGGRVNWSPVVGLTLSSRIALESIVPDQSQTSAPLLEMPQVRVYDYTTGELAEVTVVSGGNPELKRGSSRGFNGDLSIMPWSWEGPTLNLGYVRREARGGIGGLPTLTPDVEAAFPGRVTRDAAGQLIRIDQRSINFDQDLGETLSTRFNWTIPFGPKELPPGAETGGAPGGLVPETKRGRRGPRLSLSLNHSWQLKNRLVIRKGLPELDRLKGEGGGQSRHTLQAAARLGWSGSNVALSLD
ncbi:MAG: hypothetical protein P0Y56_08725 [Candidatus Andeanibacterium colombiense]|uniref:TonB-dependent receptor plug domain-containing protein n=1 Tax=Candidatus Andeanibacterium colombiense TaxID=3121345 RepID=A0AAJ5X9P8_9SPHN|nr:MAG: hypothetical protein P0Y56_08725 [Sphingomonadaceae bacterium]